MRSAKYIDTEPRYDKGTRYDPGGWPPQCVYDEQVDKSRPTNTTEYGRHEWSTPRDPAVAPSVSHPTTIHTIREGTTGRVARRTFLIEAMSNQEGAMIAPSLLKLNKMRKAQRSFLPCQGCTKYGRHRHGRSILVEGMSNEDGALVVASSLRRPYRIRKVRSSWSFLPHRDGIRSGRHNSRGRSFLINVISSEEGTIVMVVPSSLRLY
ncbi:hypothetical protein BJX68DRAFT_123669 [Aspergillus pseudodeflectus]|uniref:Uncharacterized protein n=1 Tax=Aspergillus pseudodeflectus TaxID=176178 RepID=A0ABR4K362_9EURO